MELNHKGNGYSAEVRMHLRVNVQLLRIGQLEPDFLILDDVVVQPPGRANVTVSVAGRISQCTVHLPEGISVARSETRIAL